MKKAKKVYEWLDERGRGVVSNWPRLQSAQRAKLDAKLRMLANAEVDPVTRKANLPPGLLAGPGYDGFQFIYKLRPHGNVQLRPMICLGPFSDDEWTVLYESKEVGDKLIPPDAPALAEGRRQVLLADEDRRKRLTLFADEDDEADDHED